jgi:hypothetical protein
VPYKTTLGELKALGFDPQDSVNVTVIPYPEMVSQPGSHRTPACRLMRSTPACVTASWRRTAMQGLSVPHSPAMTVSATETFILDFLNFVRHVQVTRLEL